MKHIMICPECHTYSMDDKCSCGASTVDPKPAKYSPDDKYAEMKRRLKEEDYRARGLL